MARRAVGVDLDVQHPSGDDAPVAGAGDAAVLQGVLDGEEHARGRAPVAVVHQHGAPPQKIAVALQRQIDDRVEQGLAGVHEGRRRLAGRRDQRLLERDPLVAGQHRLAAADRPAAAADGRRDVRYLVAARLALAGRAAEPAERLQEERLDVVGLEPARFGPFELGADALHAADVHGVVGQLPVLDEVLQRAPVERLIDRGVEPRAHLRLLAVPHGG